MVCFKGLFCLCFVLFQVSDTLELGIIQFWPLNSSGKWSWLQHIVSRENSGGDAQFLSLQPSQQPDSGQRFSYKVFQLVMDTDVWDKWKSKDWNCDGKRRQTDFFTMLLCVQLCVCKCAVKLECYTLSSWELFCCTARVCMHTHKVSWFVF